MDQRIDPKRAGQRRAYTRLESIAISSGPNRFGSGVRGPRRPIVIKSNSLWWCASTLRETSALNSLLLVRWHGWHARSMPEGKQRHYRRSRSLYTVRSAARMLLLCARPVRGVHACVRWLEQQRRRRMVVVVPERIGNSRTRARAWLLWQM